MKAMILSAGMGTRLGNITENIPKALVDINGRSVLRIAVEKCTLSGFGDIIINVHHYADLVEREAENLREEGFKISISDERDQLLETGGGLYKAREFFSDEPFLLYNADVLTDIDLKKMLNYHDTGNSLATLAVRHRDGSRFFLIDSGGRLKGWINKSTGEKIVSGSGRLSEVAFSGIHIIDPQIFRYMEGGRYTMTALYLQLSAKQRISTFLHDEGYWFDMGSPSKLEEARKFLR